MGKYGFTVDDILQENQNKEIKLVKAGDLYDRLNDIRDNGKPMGLSTGQKALDPFLRWRQKGGYI